MSSSQTRVLAENPLILVIRTYAVRINLDPNTNITNQDTNITIRKLHPNVVSIGRVQKFVFITG